MDKSEQTLRLKIAHADLTDWYDRHKKRSERFGIPLLVSNVDLFMEAIVHHCKNLDEIQAVVDDIKQHKELYEGIYSPLYLRPVPPANVDDAIRDLEFDIKEKRAGREHIY
ncbi:MAG: hypothetical protein E7055_01730 [Lentisphaerae bacterium]|nr:hypothetical protein [Lentisphaerota bacterium]